jgi:hypothetical protein
MKIDDLKKECQYCCREIDASGLEGFRCTNRTVIKITASSWCYPKNANEPCSMCNYCKPREDNKITIDDAIEIFRDTRSYGTADIAKLVAIATMRKYKKIEQIIKKHDNDSMPEDYWYIDKIREVLEDKDDD